jgi:GNAT superfamily N-acetyltransferase
VTGWSSEQVRAEAGAWVFVPDDARELRTDELHLVSYPASYAIPPQVAWCRSPRPAAAVVDDVVHQARAWGEAEVSFWVDEDTRPPDLADHLRGLGARQIESVEVLARVLEEPVPRSTGGIEVRQVTDERTLLDAALVAREVWHQPVPSGEELTRRLAELDRPEQLRVVAYLEGQPVAAGGTTLAGEVARLWGAATREPWRGRGAYRAVLEERLRLARERGSTLALVKAVTDTSAPLLRRWGFAGHGLQHRLRLPLGRQGGGGADQLGC